MKSLVLLTLAATFAAGAWAADPSPAQKAQQERMARCNKDAEGKAGDERKAFMSDCLSGKTMTPQERMKDCNVRAEGKAGDERKAFMSECLKAK
jgi:hypothetical protein